LTTCGKALALRQKLADAKPKVPEYRQRLTYSHNDTADVLRRLGGNAEARDGCEQAIAVDKRLVQDHPQVALYRLLGPGETTRA